MALFKFFHMPKPRGYNYNPVFYDPDKEQREARLKEIAGDDEATLQTRMKSGFQQYRGKGRSSAITRANIRMMIILGILILISYYIFFT